MYLYLYFHFYIYLYLSSPGGSDQVWHCWVPQIHEQQDKDHRRWPFRVSLEAVSKSITTLSQPDQYQPPCAHWTWATTSWWNCPSTRSVKPKPSTGLICTGELTIEESICHDFFQEWFHNFSNQLARKMLQKSSLTLMFAPKQSSVRSFPKLSLNLRVATINPPKWIFIPQIYFRNQITTLSDNDNI